MRLTGRTRYRVGLGRRLVLQVQETGLRSWTLGGCVESDLVTVWRDARAEDLQILALHAGGSHD